MTTEPSKSEQLLDSVEGLVRSIECVAGSISNYLGTPDAPMELAESEYQNLVAAHVALDRVCESLAVRAEVAWINLAKWLAAEKEHDLNGRIRRFQGGVTPS